MTHERLGFHILRLGLATLFLWFGFSQLVDGLSWVAWVPSWAVVLFNLPPAMLVLLNGLAEVLLGSLLALGLWVRPVALILGFHLFIITLEIGATAIGVRDFGLTCATFALALLVPAKPKI
jgi:uncharacterized membrane protein YphA (DoxX/SURF4 family)